MTRSPFSQSWPIIIRTIISGTRLFIFTNSFFIYWYKNNFHYLRNWEHLKGLKSAYKLPISLLERVPDYGRVSLPRTDEIMSRMQMIEIRLSWTQEQLENIKGTIRRVLDEVLSR